MNIFIHSKGRTYIGFYNNQSEHQFMDISGTYAHKFFDGLDLKFMVGASQEQYQYQGSWGTKYDLLDPSLSVFDAATGESSLSGGKNEWAMRSYFGRLNLGWMDKYLAEFNLRADGSSRFLGDNRWGYFPSASVGWRLDKEKFMEPLFGSGVLNTLKLRASYGGLGNNAIVSDYAAQSLYSASNYVLNGALQQGLAKLAIANADVTWETTVMANIGVDFSMFNNRLVSTFEYFKKTAVDILIDLPAPMLHGATTLPPQNAGEVQNKGVEFSTEWRDHLASGFNYFIKGNISHIKNKVTKYKGNDYSIWGNGLIKEGVPIQAQYVRIVDRIVQTDADLAFVQSIIDNAPKDASGKVLNPFPYGRPVKGDILYKDLNKDGLINDEDRTTVGNGPNPTLMYGVSLGFEFKGFDFSMLMQGVSGIKMYYNDNYYTSNTRFGYLLNREIVEGRWYEGRESPATYPRLLDFSNTKNILPSDLWVVDKSYMKIRNIQLGYTFPRQLFSKAGLSTLRLYASLENFFTFTKYPGIDPEVSGMDYPPMKQAVFGINLSF